METIAERLYQDQRGGNGGCSPCKYEQRLDDMQSSLEDVQGNVRLVKGTVEVMRSSMEAMSTSMETQSATVAKIHALLLDVPDKDRVIEIAENRSNKAVIRHKRDCPQYRGAQSAIEETAKIKLMKPLDSIPPMARSLFSKVPRPVLWVGGGIGAAAATYSAIMAFLG